MILHLVTNGFSKWLLSAKIQLDPFFFVLFAIGGRKQRSCVVHSVTFPRCCYTISYIKITLITVRKKSEFVI